VLAGFVLVVAALFAGILDPIPVSAVLSSLTGGTSMSDGSFSAVVFVGLPFVLALVVLLRSASRTPVEIVLGLLDAPCLLVGLWAFTTTPYPPLECTGAVVYHRVRVVTGVRRPRRC
jgi:hypothetical protein